MALSAARCAASEAKSFAIEASSVGRASRSWRVGRLHCEEPAGIELGGHVRQHPLDRLVVADRLTERVV